MNTVKALIIGFAASLATIAIAALMPIAMALELLFGILMAIAAVYFGFLARDGRKRESIIEFGGIALTLALAALGLWVSPYWLALGYFIHGIWDFMHHPRGIQTEMPRWYIPFCVIYDWALAIFILLWWR